MSRLILPRRDLIVPNRNAQRGFLINPYALASGSSLPGAHRYWRIYVTATSGADPYCTIQELELRTTSGGSDVTSPSTPATDSSHFAARTASGAIDNVLTGDEAVWTANNSLPAWAAYDLGTDTNIVEVTIMAAVNASIANARAPKDFLIQWSSNGSSYTTARTVTGETAWSAGEVRTFSVP